VSVTGILALIERLPPGEGVCHADLHPGNVIITADGPRIIDWAGTVCAPAAFDLGRCHAHLVELVYSPESVDPAPPSALNAAVQSEYARLADMPPATLAVATESYLPIVRAFTLADRATNPARRARLTLSVEATLRSEGLI
jgi:Ser/Thr protein kinase RdoA (MazF antagonist)